ncbi:helix-turn-helix transcriptional regulator [Streptomyces sp. NPDC046887]|uniref:helix-turn-helix domain-containing protein n=1 Tax=Streptomyces sp. NPDC046887 TaxID=3155472 RepID=UPI0033F488AB
MAARKKNDDFITVSKLYGKELRHKRNEARLTLEQLAEDSFYGLGFISEIERGNRSMPEDLASHVDRVLKTDGYFLRNCEDVRKARLNGHAPYFETVLEAERRALTIEQWSQSMFPGLLQTEPYIRALFKADPPLETAEEIEKKIIGRLERAELFAQDPIRPEYWIVLHEIALRKPVLPPDLMAEQLEHVAALVRSGRITLQVLPWNEGAHALMANNAMILTFADEPPLFYTESQYHGQTIDYPPLVKQYRRSYDRLRAAALSPEASLALIEQAAKDWRNGAHGTGLEHRGLA